MRTLIWLLVLALPACLPQADDRDVPRDLGNAADPEGYRAEIQSLEASLFHEGPLRPGEADGIAFSLEEIARRVRAREQTRLGSIFAGEMERLAERIDSGRGTLGRSRPAMREQWMRIRSSLFADAIWYCWNPGEVPPVAPAFTPALDARGLADLRHTIRSLESVLRTGQLQTAQLGEPRSDRDYVRGQYVVDAERWRDWRSKWLTELDALERGLPDKPPLGSSAYSHYAAYDKVERALAVLRGVPSGRGGWSIPTRAHTEQCFEEARGHLTSALELLAQSQG